MMSLMANSIVYRPARSSCRNCWRRNSTSTTEGPIGAPDVCRRDRYQNQSRNRHFPGDTVSFPYPCPLEGELPGSPFLFARAEPAPGSRRWSAGQHGAPNATVLEGLRHLGSKNNSGALFLSFTENPPKCRTRSSSRRWHSGTEKPHLQPRALVLEGSALCLWRGLSLAQPLCA